MSHVDLNGDEWLALSDGGAEGVAAAVAREVGAALVSVRAHSYAGRSGRVALFERDGIRYALVPGATVELGYDPARFVPTSRQQQDFAAAVAAYSVPKPIHIFLAEQMSPARRATLPARLVAVRSVDADSLLTAEHDGTDDHESVMARLEWLGLRPPTPDEWEYDCGAGATTLFRWGDEYPSGEPYGDVPLIQDPNFFGLVIGDDPYRAEFTTDPAVLCGGDGGSALCGGYGGFFVLDHVGHRLPRSGPGRSGLRGLPRRRNARAPRPATSMISLTHLPRIAPEVWDQLGGSFSGLPTASQ